MAMDGVAASESVGQAERNYRESAVLENRQRGHSFGGWAETKIPSSYDVSVLKNATRDLEYRRYERDAKLI
jgi:hypothetical protein